MSFPRTPRRFQQYDRIPDHEGIGETENRAERALSLAACHKGRSYHVMTRPADGHHHDPDAWQAAAPRKEGSWWPEWTAWLDRRSGAFIDAERSDDHDRAAASLGPAPGTYVLQP
jgi:hypothetical protein